jgi:hypothetical protein
MALLLISKLRSTERIFSIVLDLHLGQVGVEVVGSTTNVMGIGSPSF